MQILKSVTLFCEINTVKVNIFDARFVLRRAERPMDCAGWAATNWRLNSQPPGCDFKHPAMELPCHVGLIKCNCHGT